VKPLIDITNLSPSQKRDGEENSGNGVIIDRDITC
jgi:hypothetical protein